MRCRACSAPLDSVFLDLGTSPPSNAFLTREDLHKPEVWLPLKLFTCSRCLLVQTDEIPGLEELFGPDYVYFSSYSSTWVRHAERYVDQVVARLALGPRNLVVELASNDGYLLQHVAARGIPCLGIEPTAGTARVARAKGIETLVRFFGRDLADELARTRGLADLVVGNNVLAHVPDINDFVAGIARLLAPQGVATLEFPHLLELVVNRQFDTVYHEHFSYLSFHTVQRLFATHDLRIWDVDRLPTHGGSLRVWACHAQATHAPTAQVAAIHAMEADAGMLGMDWYCGLQQAAEQVKDGFLAFLLEQKRAGKLVAGYGAAAKGNTLLNFAGVRADLLRFVCDASPHKQGRFLPGARIPVVPEGRLRETRPDFVCILPWNLRAEIMAQLDYIGAWGGRFVVAIPALQVLEPCASR